MYDCLIIGGGPAGLTAATYLGRFLRRSIVIDAGKSRLQRIPRSRNAPGFPDGIDGKALLARMVDQASRYGAEFAHTTVRELFRTNDGFAARTDLGEVRAHIVLLATGVEVSDPDIENLDAAIAIGAIRYCPICDGFEVQGKNLAVLGGRPASIEEARFLRTYSARVTFVPAAKAFVANAAETALAGARGITLESRTLLAMRLVDEGVRMEFGQGAAATFDVVYPCLGARPRSGLAVDLGADVSSGGGVLTDHHQMTSVEGLFAAGDVLEGVDQIASACGQAAIAATAIHNMLSAAVNLTK